ncbi:MAG: rRNA maturation RNase YbeY [Candidatus Babeliales bacterium]
MITIRNTQRKIQINEKKIRENVQQILDILDYSDFDIGIWLTTNKTIQAYNRDYRNKDKPTDILSFPFYPDLKPPKRIYPKNEDEKNLGDIIISLEYVKKDAQRLGISFEKRIQILLVHGICHLLGYDHQTDDDYKIMRKKEAFLLKKLNSA